MRRTYVLVCTHVYTGMPRRSSIKKRLRNPVLISGTILALTIPSLSLVYNLLACLFLETLQSYYLQLSLNRFTLNIYKQQPGHSIFTRLLLQKIPSVSASLSVSSFICTCVVVLLQVRVRRRRCHLVYVRVVLTGFKTFSCLASNINEAEIDQQILDPITRGRST